LAVNVAHMADIIRTALKNLARKNKGSAK